VKFLENEIPRKRETKKWKEGRNPLLRLHEIRYYKKMNTVLKYHHAELIGFLTKIWEFSMKNSKTTRKKTMQRTKVLVDKMFDTLLYKN
jgi:hypothetical protein